MSNVTTISRGYFMLFGGDQYYPHGGIADLLFINSDVNVLLNSVRPQAPFTKENSKWNILVLDSPMLDVGWWHIFSTHTVEVIARSHDMDYFSVDFFNTGMLAKNCRVTDPRTGILLP